MDDLATEIHWKSLCLALPANGITKTFKTEADCLRRLVAVRFPAGVTCHACESDRLSYLTDRDFYYCKNCQCQFSARYGTVFERSNLPLLKWFQCAEVAIKAHDAKKLSISFSINAVTMRLNVSRRTAIRLRKAVTKELLKEDGGILGQCISDRKFDFPEAIEPGTQAHLSWLEDNVGRQKGFKRASE